MGWDLGGLGDGPQIWGGRITHVSVPQYFEKCCYWMWGKVQTDEKGLKEEFISEIEVFGQDFGQEKGHMCYISEISDSRDRNIDKIESMTKANRQKFWVVKWNSLPKRSFENLGREIFCVPSNSAPSLRQCLLKAETTNATYFLFSDVKDFISLLRDQKRNNIAALLGLRTCLKHTTSPQSVSIYVRKALK